MHLFLTGVLPFLAHDHASAAAFLTCRHHNFHASMIPEFLSRDESFMSFCCARQQNEYRGDGSTKLSNLYKLFVQTPLMQFSPSLLLIDEDCTETILNQLLETKYFTRSLQRCLVPSGVTPVLEGLSKVRSLIKLDFATKIPAKTEHVELIINSFPSIETLNIQNAALVDPTTAISIISPPPPTTKTLRSLTIRSVDAWIATQFVPNFSNLRKLVIRAPKAYQDLDLLPFTSSLPLLTELSLDRFNVENVESLKSLVHLSTLQFRQCRMPESLSFLTHTNDLALLTRLYIEYCEGLANNSFASLSNVPNIHVLKLTAAGQFDNDCLQYLQDMIHLRKLDLSCTTIVGDSRSLKTLMQNVFQLEELDLSCCHIGGQGAIAGALYSTHSRLRILNVTKCDLVDDDLNGIGLLKNTLEELCLGFNINLTTEALVHCRDLVKLKRLNLRSCDGINDLSPLKDCLNLEELFVGVCHRLLDDSFKVFSEEPESFPNLRVLDLSYCRKLTEYVVGHLPKNSNLVHQLKDLNVEGMSEILTSSPTALNNLCQLKGLRQLRGMMLWFTNDMLKCEVIRNLKNLETLV